MINDTIFNKININNIIKPLAEYSTSLTGVLDDFWEDHILSAEAYSILLNNIDIGFFTVYNNDKITSFYVEKEFFDITQRIFRQILDEFKVKTAFVATCDELFLSLCLDNHKNVKMQAYFFKLSSKKVREPEWDRSLLNLAKLEDINDILDKEGVAENIKAGKYYVMRKNGIFVGQGFYSRNEINPEMVSIGMSVHPDYRQKGVGRSIIIHLKDICLEQGLIPNCGCWYYNHNSKKTLGSAGFVTKTRLLNIQFEESKYEQ
ncbi:MAG: hypothetical protein A2Y17_10905 [Clostridiales bacterium GWF2_38_85]|nr:MAG: hypothetical protein A2Y17_10905 [Clostridiales bacterium GWF2_38_85]